MRLRTTARWAVVVLALGFMLFALQRGPSSAVGVHAQQPDVYQVTAMSAAADTRHYQTGSPVDPAPAINTAIPLTSIVADNAPKTDAHAAFAEPPQTAQAATGLQNVPVPYPTQVEALCANCATPVINTAEGDTDQSLDGSRIQSGGGSAHAQAAPLAAVADAANGRQTIGPDDQVKNLYDAAVSDAYSQVINKPAPSASPAPPGVPAPFNQPPACQTAPAPVPSVAPSAGQVCPSTLPLADVLARTSSSDSRTTVDTGDAGTVVDSFASLGDTQILDGLITIGAIRTEVKATGDGVDAHSTITATTDVLDVCAGTVCNLSITAAGVCPMAEASNVQLCTNDPINQQLRQNGINVCRLGTATSGSKTSTVTGTAAGVLVEFHAQGTASNGYAPDGTYFNGEKGLCLAASPTPRPGYSGINSWTVLGESSVQLFTRTFPTCTSCGSSEEALPISLDNGSPGETIPGVPGSTVTTITNPGASGSAPRNPGAGGAAFGTPRISTTAAALPDRRPLELAAFALLEVVLLGNLTMMAAMRRTGR